MANPGTEEANDAAKLELMNRVSLVDPLIKERGDAGIGGAKDADLSVQLGIWAALVLVWVLLVGNI